MNEQPPLCVDLDGTFTPVDTLHESLLCAVRNAPLKSIGLLPALFSGKAAFKRRLALLARADVNLIPVHSELLVWLQQEKSRGRLLALATAADRDIAHAVATRYPLFDEVFASDGAINLSGEAKRTALVRRFGEKGFDYAGNDANDLCVWRSARGAVVVNADDEVLSGALKNASVERVFPRSPGRLKLWFGALRVHQWVKNLLVFLPLVLAHRVADLDLVIVAVLAALSFCLCASSTYLLNDLLDLEADRAHPRKRNRAFASGALPVSQGAIGSIVLLLLAAAIAVPVGPLFLGLLALYYATTVAYSVQLKTFELVDVMILSGLYTLRILAGAAATGVQISLWLLAFAVFIFLSLAFVKRFAELQISLVAGGEEPARRGYKIEDLPLLSSLGAASGYAAVVVFALYVSSPESEQLYQRPEWLWLICPLLLFWISRVWLLTNRGRMHDDPVVFALRDGASLGIGALIVLIAALAALY